MNAAGENGTGGRPGEGELLLREFAHRTGNEIAVAIGALSLAARGGRDGRSGKGAIDEAIDRLRCFGELHRLLARPVDTEVDLGRELVELFRSVRGSRPSAGATRLKMDVERAVVDGAVARRVLMVAAELATNAYKYALDGRSGELAVTLRVVGGRILLTISDDGPGMAAVVPRGTGYGSGIVEGLLAGIEGAITVTTETEGTSVVVEVPLVDGTADAA